MKSAMTVYYDFFKNISRNVKLYLGIIFFVTIVSSAYNVLFGIYLKNVGFTEAFVGQILSINTMGIAFGAIPMAIFAERLNRKKTIIFGMLLMVISNLIVLNVQVPMVMQIFAFIFGIGNSTLMILQAPIIYDNTPDQHRITAFSMAFVLQNVAFVLGSLVLGHLSGWITHYVGPVSANRWVLNAATSLIFIGVLIAMRFTGDEMTAKKHEHTIKETLEGILAGYRRMLVGKPLFYLMQVSLIGLGAGMIVPFFSMYLKYTLQTTDGIVGNIMAISQVGTVIGGLVVPPLAKKLGRVRTVIICQLLSIPFLISILFPQGIIIITISFFFRSSLMNMAGPIIGNLAMEIVDDETRTYMSSMVSLVSHLFRAVGIYIGGYLMFKYDYNTPYYFTIVCYLIGTYILYNVFKNINKKEHLQ
ncbi:MAG: MFS transporter [Firmicutes bacterium]|nr:MFS transporter [Bacillota bacterium]